MRLKPLFFMLLSLHFASCGSMSKGSKDLLERAHLKQKEAIARIDSIEEVLATSELQAKDSLQAVLKELEESLFKIPGYQLDLPGHEGHDHNHSRIELSAQEIFNVQEELLKQLQQIHNNLRIQ